MRVVTLAVAVVTALMLMACGGRPRSSEDSSGMGSSELAGKPWVTSIIQGNLPAERPVITEECFTYYNYDYLADHQSNPSMAIVEHMGEIRDANVRVIKGASKASHGLDQLRIFFGQASDIERLKETGLAERQFRQVGLMWRESVHSGKGLDAPKDGSLSRESTPLTPRRGNRRVTIRKHVLFSIKIRKT